MDQPAQTLNQDPSSEGMGASSSPDSPHFDPNAQNIISTVEDIEPDDLEGVADDSSEETLKTDDSGEQDKSGEKPGTSDKDLPFHEHPRWKERQAEIEELRSEVNRLKSVPKEEPAAKLPYVDITQMEVEKLQEWQVEDPKGYAANLYAQMRYELAQETAQQTGQQRQKETFQKDVASYREKNPDFDVMMKSGEIQKFLADHPAHNPLSAHQFLTVEKRLNEAVESARKEEREKIFAQVKAKKHAQVLGSGPAVSSGPAEDDEIKDTKSRGGLTSVLSNRLALMRRKAG